MNRWICFIIYECSSGLLRRFAPLNDVIASVATQSKKDG